MCMRLLQLNFKCLSINNLQTKQDKYLVLKGNEIVLAWARLHVSDTIRPKIPVWISEIFVCRHQAGLISLYSRLGTFLTKIYSTKCFTSQEFRMGNTVPEVLSTED